MLKNKPVLFRLHNLGAIYGQRPSEIIGLDDAWAAYQFDLSCLTIGRRVEKALNENAAKKKNARKPEGLVIAGILGTSEGVTQYAPLAQRAPVKTLRPGDPDYEIIKQMSERQKKEPEG